MTQDVRLEWASKMWLLAIAIVHWIIFFAMVYSRSSTASNQPVAVVSQFASAAHVRSLPEHLQPSRLGRQSIGRPTRF